MPRRKQDDLDDGKSMEAMAYVQGSIRRSVYLYGIDAATQLGIRWIQWADFALGEYIESLDWKALTPKQRMRREYLMIRRDREDKKMLRELVRAYELDKDEEKLARITEYCDALGVTVAWALEDAVRTNETDEIYQEADAQMNHALDWAKKYFRGKTTVLSKTVEQDAESEGITHATLKEIKSLFSIPSKRGLGSGLSYSWLVSESKPLQDFILRNKIPSAGQSGSLERVDATSTERF